MLRSIEGGTLGRGSHGWLDSHFHFSFAEYYNPENINFGALRVWNDDTILPGTGFDTHPHENMEIISYVIDGTLSHADSIGNERSLTRGQVQYMSAGTGITHSEYNNGNVPLRFFQIWIFADKPGHTPNYGEHRFIWEDRLDKWMHIATDIENSESYAPIKIHQDVNIFATELTTDKSLTFTVYPERQAYLVVAEGKVRINGIGLRARDAMEITEEEITVNSLEDAHIVLVEMAKA